MASSSLRNLSREAAVYKEDRNSWSDRRRTRASLRPLLCIRFPLRGNSDAIRLMFATPTPEGVFLVAPRGPVELWIRRYIHVRLLLSASESQMSSCSSSGWNIYREAQLSKAVVLRSSRTFCPPFIGVSTPSLCGLSFIWLKEAVMGLALTGSPPMLRLALMF